MAQAAVDTDAAAHGVTFLSIDVGTRNLGVAVATLTAPVAAAAAGRPGALVIHKWDVLDVPAQAGVHDVDVNATKIDALVPLFAAVVPPYLRDALGAAAPRRVSVAYIEVQGVNMAMRGGGHQTRFASNEKTKSLSHVLQAFLCQLGVRVEFASSALKLRGAPKHDAARTPSQRYADNKKYVKARTAALLRAQGQHAWLQWLGELSKKDDACDALMQGVESASDVLVERARVAGGGAPRKASAATVAAPAAKRLKLPSHAVAANLRLDAAMGADDDEPPDEDDEVAGGGAACGLAAALKEPPHKKRKPAATTTTPAQPPRNSAGTAWEL